MYFTALNAQMALKACDPFQNSHIQVKLNITFQHSISGPAVRNGMKREHSVAIRGIIGICRIKETWTQIISTLVWNIPIFPPLSHVLFSFPSFLPGDAAPDGGWPGPPSLQQPERHAGEGGRDLDLFPVQSANRPWGGSPAGRTEDQMLRYTLPPITTGVMRLKR